MQRHKYLNTTKNIKIGHSNLYDLPTYTEKNENLENSLPEILKFIEDGERIPKSSLQVISINMDNVF